MYRRINFLQKKMESEKLNKLECFDGTGDDKRFITRIHLEASLKGYEDAKNAQYLGSKLLGLALDVYMQLIDEEKTRFNIIRDELFKEFERGQLNREDALRQLERRNRQSNETALTYAYKIIELMKLAYPTFELQICTLVRPSNTSLLVLIFALQDLLFRCFEHSHEILPPDSSFCFK